MDVIARLPESAGQAADAASAHTHNRIEHAPKLWKLQSQNVQIPGHVYQDTSGRKLGQTSKIQSFLLRQICMVKHFQAYCERDHCKSSIWDQDG